MVVVPLSASGENIVNAAGTDESSRSTVVEPYQPRSAENDGAEEGRPWSITRCTTVSRRVAGAVCMLLITVPLAIWLSRRHHD